jgi:hypothetical protein
MEPSASNFANPGSSQSVNVDVTVGFAAWAQPGIYSIQADARSWSDYDNTFTSGDSDGQATMIIAKPDLLFGDVRYTSHATGFGESGVGWVKKTGGDPYFSFMFEVLNTGTESVGSFFVGVFDVENAGVQIAIYWTGTGWAIDEFLTNSQICDVHEETGTCFGSEIVIEGNKKYITLKATASELGMSDGAADGTNAAYSFYLIIDTKSAIPESNDEMSGVNNNRVPITITAVKEINTVPSFALSMLGITLSGLLAAVGMSLRRKEEE